MKTCDEINLRNEKKFTLSDGIFISNVDFVAFYSQYSRTSEKLIIILIEYF